MTVTYGDQNITITEGGNTYNVYYVTEYQAPPHTHTYSSTITRAATCTDPGVETFTCVDGDSTYTKAIPATGHNWILKTESLTEYDEYGELVQNGYKIYKCSVCGEEYRVDDDSGPPPVPTAVLDPFVTAPPVIAPAFTNEHGLPSGWDELRNTLIGFFTELPETISDVLEFMSGTFSYIPAPIISMITFGVAMAVLVGLFKLFFR